MASAEADVPSGDVRTVLFWYPPPSTRHEDDGLPTHTSREQREAERRVSDSQRFVLPHPLTTAKKSKKMSFFGGDDDDEEGQDAADSQQAEAAELTSCPALCELSVSSHAVYLLNGLSGGSGCHTSLDCSIPWLIYWCLHGLDVLDRLADVSPELGRSVVAYLARCEASDGGFAGGPGQQAHTAPTYAAVLSLAILSSHEDAACAAAAVALLRSARQGIYAFHIRCKVNHAGAGGVGAGGFRVSRDGEVDTRGAYTVLSVASLLSNLTAELTAGVADWLVQCQTYEGGIGGEPGTEAHGGYAFCGLAACVLLNASSRLNVSLLLKWACSRQMEREGGFQGRTNKLVDGCYSFWMGALFPLLHALMRRPNQLNSPPPPPSSEEGPSSAAAAAAASPSPSPAASVSAFSSSGDAGWLFDTLALQRYVLVSCQTSLGGLRDKPGKAADLYHSCYCLAGLSLAQHATSLRNSPLLGRKENLLAPIHPIYNIRYAHVDRVMAVFANEKN